MCEELDGAPRGAPGREAALIRLLESAIRGHGRVVELNRLRGGAKKGVRRARWQDEFTAVVYVWDPSQDYLRAHHDGSSTGREDDGAFTYARIDDRLRSLGVRTPALYLLETSRSEFPFHVAVVQAVDGATLEELWRAAPADAVPALHRLREMLEAMHGSHRPGPTRPGRLIPEATADRCEDIMLARALADLEHVAAHVEEVAGRRRLLGTLVVDLHSRIDPRAECGLIHGELGPDHVLIDGDGMPVLIDFDGAHFFDVELEHAFMDFRFAEHYDRLRLPGLDPKRMLFYRLCLDLSFSSGPITLLKAGHPEQDFVAGIINARVKSMLAILRSHNQ